MDIELTRRISNLENQVETMQEQLNILWTVMLEVGGKAQVCQSTLIQILTRQSEQSAIAQDLRASVESAIQKQPHFEPSIRLALNAVLEAAGHAPKT